MQIAAEDALFKCLAEFISSHLRSAQPQSIAIGKYFNVNFLYIFKPLCLRRTI
jgi:hypothetical protein